MARSHTAPIARAFASLAPEAASARDLSRADASVIAFGLDDWSGPPQTRQHILAGLANLGWPVTFTNGPHFVWGVRQPKWQHASWRSRTGQADGVQLNWPGRWLLRWPRASRWDRHVQRRYVSFLTSAAGWDIARHRIAYVFHPVFVPYLAALGDCQVVYHADDSFSRMPGWSEELALAERALVTRAALIVASSPGVRRNLPGTGPSRAHVLQNGADTALFAAGGMGDAPADLASIPRPRIGYCGAINPKLDLALVDRLAGLRQEWHWVFVGKCIEHRIMADAASRPAWERLCRRPNVHFLGPRSYHDIPRYQAHMDVNTLCYRTDGDGWWTSLSPLKLHEYLAVGRPVVAASLEVLERLRHVVAVAEREEEWLSALGDAIHEGGVGTPEERRRVAFENDWKAIVDQLDSWLVATMAQPVSPAGAVCPDIPVPQPATP